MTNQNGMPPAGGYVYGASKGQPSPTRATGAVPPGDPRRLRELERELAASGVLASDEPGKPAAAPARTADPGSVNRQPHIHVSRLHPHPDNIREDIGDLTEMAASVRAHGILQPIAVEPHPQIHGHFQIVAGHRRYAAAKRAGLDMVPVTFRQAGSAQPEELMLIENLHREGLNPMEKAEAMGALRKKGYTAAQIARSTGVKESTVSYYLALLELDTKAQERVRKGDLSAAEAVAAVRKVRKRQRKAEGRPVMGGGEWEPDHFTMQHPLARKAKALCEAREHTLRRRVGKISCGQCGETVIRNDERTVAAALADEQLPRSAS
jgi:ParB family chromosome partitioning protein